MNDQQPYRASRKGPLYLISVSAVAGLIGAGLCGFIPHTGAEDLERAILGAIVICASGIGLLSGVVWLLSRVTAPGPSA